MSAIFTKNCLLIPCSTFGVDHIESLDMRSELASLQRECGDEAAAAETEAGMLEVGGGASYPWGGKFGVTALQQRECGNEAAAAEMEAGMLEVRGSAGGTHACEGVGSVCEHCCRGGVGTRRQRPRWRRAC